MKRKIKAFLVGTFEYMVIVTTILTIYIIVAVIWLSKWGDHRYLIGGIYTPNNSIIDRKSDTYLEENGDSIKISEQYIYSVKGNTLLKIDYCHDEYFLYNASSIRIELMKKDYGDKFQVLNTLGEEDKKIYQELITHKTGYPIESLGKRMWDEFSF